MGRQLTDGVLYMVGLFLMLFGFAGLVRGEGGIIPLALGGTSLVLGGYIVNKMKHKYPPKQEKPRESIFDLTRNEKIFAVVAIIIMVIILIFMSGVLMG